MQMTHESINIDVDNINLILVQHSSGNYLYKVAVGRQVRYSGDFASIEIEAMGSLKQACEKSAYNLSTRV
jgi:hypothetical protein